MGRSHRALLRPAFAQFDTASHVWPPRCMRLQRYPVTSEGDGLPGHEGSAARDPNQARSSSTKTVRRACTLVVATGWTKSWGRRPTERRETLHSTAVYDEWFRSVRRVGRMETRERSLHVTTGRPSNATPCTAARESACASSRCVDSTAAGFPFPR